MRQLSLDALFGTGKREVVRSSVGTKHTVVVEPDNGLGPSCKFVDLFAGFGGASVGATDAGCDVVLAVDCWKEAMEVHALNHPETVHLCVSLPPEQPLPLPAAGERWHMHGSPPCTALSKAATHDRTDQQREDGLEMVRWYIDYALESSATTWSMEQVPTKSVCRLLRSYRLAGAPHRNLIDWDVFDFCHFGVPQHRKRILAGTPSLIAKMRRARKQRRSAQEFIAEPKGTHLRNNALYGNMPKNGTKKDRKKYSKDELVLPITGPSYTVCAAQSLRWATPYTNTPLIWLTAHESARLQAFPERYKLHKNNKISQTGVGNAVPPPVLTQMLNPSNRPVSPSLVWRP